MKFLNTEVAPLGLGCWPIGGEMYAADGGSLGYTNSDDGESIKAIHAALANGVTVFDTAAAYGAGHSERLLSKALANHPEAVVVTKIGLEIDEQSRTIIGEALAPEAVIPAIDACLSRLKRDTIDLLLLHPNQVALELAGHLFDEMDRACDLGKIRAYGWSTDYVDNVQAMKARHGFTAVEHAMHVLMDAPKMQSLVQQAGLYALIRSPLAMGLLSGKYGVESVMPADDIRATEQSWTNYYIDGKPNPEQVKRFDAVKELLQVGGRSPVQGALGWLWGKSASNIPIPGARTVEQVEGLAAAVGIGPLPGSVMAEIDQLIGGAFISDGNTPR